MTDKTNEKLEEVVLISAVRHNGKTIPPGKHPLPLSLILELSALKDSPIKSDDVEDEGVVTDQPSDVVPLADYEAALEKNTGLTNELVEIKDALVEEKEKHKFAKEEITRLQTALAENQDELTTAQNEVAELKQQLEAASKTTAKSSAKK